MGPFGQPPSPGPAIDDRPTRAAMRGYALRAVGIAFGGLVFTAIVGGLAPALGAVGLFVCVYGLVCVVHAARMRAVLGRHPWRSYQCRFREVPGLGNGSPTLVLESPTSGEGTVLGVVGVVWRWRALNACDGQVVWMAGDPARSGVVSTPGGIHLLWARRPRWAGRRERLRQAVVGAGLR